MTTLRLRRGGGGKQPGLSSGVLTEKSNEASGQNCLPAYFAFPFGSPLTKSCSTCFSLTDCRFQTKLRVLFGSTLTKSHSACFSLTDCRFQTKLRVPFGSPLTPSLPHPAVQFTG